VGFSPLWGFSPPSSLMGFQSPFISHGVSVPLRLSWGFSPPSSLWGFSPPSFLWVSFPCGVFSPPPVSFLAFFVSMGCCPLSLSNPPPSYSTNLPTPHAYNHTSSFPPWCISQPLPPPPPPPPLSLTLSDSMGPANDNPPCCGAAIRVAWLVPPPFHLPCI
jgi:hypothetical protein